MESLACRDLVQGICARFDNDRQRLLDILLAVQQQLRCIDGQAHQDIAEALGCSRVEVQGVASFYAFFSATPRGEVAIYLCDDIIDRQAGLAAVSAAFEQELDIAVGETSADGRFSLHYTPCIGMSDQAPAALVDGVVLTTLNEDRARDIARQLREGLKPAALAKPDGDGNNAAIGAMVNNHIRQCGEVLLCEQGSDQGLQKALNMAPAEIVEQLKASGLRGRGGAGFGTGQKWQFAAAEPAARRYILCNADEGEPGTFKDRVLLTERAGLMVEGMTIAARAVGSDSGLIYLRHEYRYLLEHLQLLLRQRREQNLLGDNIGGVDGFNFDIRIQLGAGAYICGEESALISSCEGLRGEPRTRPPFPVQVGYLGCPTVVNNVETFCCVPRIIEQGADWFKAIGTGQSSGTKLFSVCGDCARPGSYELPFGVTVRELLQQAGADNCAAVQVGGPSGRLIGEAEFDRQLSFEDLPTGGSIMIFSDQRNILEIVEYFLDFFVEESCGYCTPCRVGNVFLKERIAKVRQGLAETADLDYLRELSHTIAHTSRCGLGQTSPNPVLNSLENFPELYEALLTTCDDGLKASFDIQAALQPSRHLAGRDSCIFNSADSGVADE
jgi:[NiFe] hydrogenase diaphorase moiety large subunit